MAQGGLKFDPPSCFSQHLQWGSHVSQGGFNPHNPPPLIFTLQHGSQDNKRNEGPARAMYKSRADRSRQNALRNASPLLAV